VGLLIFGGVLAATDRDRGEEQPDPPRPKVKAGADEKQPPVVQLVHPQRGSLERILVHNGSAEPVQQAELLPSVAGTVNRVVVDIGDSVKRGQLLAEIDAPALALDERLAAIGVEQAKGLLIEVEARTVVARAELDAAKTVVKQRAAELNAAKVNLALRKKQYERIKNLFEQKAVDQKILDEAEDYLRTAEVQVDAATAAVEKADRDVAVKESLVTQATASVRTAKSNIEAADLGLKKARFASAQAKIEAPFDGIITRRNYSAGDHVRPGERIADRAMFTLVRADMVRVVVSVAEREIPLTQVGVPAEVTFDALPGVRVSGKVGRVGFAVDPKTRTMRAEIDVPNAKGEIRPGMFGQVTLNCGKGPAGALRVPASAVISPPDVKPGEPDKAVYVYRDRKARLTPVRVSYRNLDEFEITSGLTADDLVVINPRGFAPKPEIQVEVEKPK
jgi:RND family efflux transporter MFP subunit